LRNRRKTLKQKEKQRRLKIYKQKFLKKMSLLVSFYTIDFF